MNTDPLAKFAPRLSTDEYQQAVAALYRRAAEGQLPAGPGGVEQAIKDAEFELAIDHKLGTNFPSDRRTALVEAKRKAEKQRLRLVQRFIQKSIKEKAFASGMQVWLEQMADAFAKVLSPEELSAFLELHEGEKPVFPIEVEKL